MFNSYESKQSCFEISNNILDAKIDILFGHPESFLSHRGRKLLKFPRYQKKVVACAVDEAHYTSMWVKIFVNIYSKL